MIDTADEQRTRRQQRYLAQVAARLADLPADERDELLDELRQHLRDVAEEGDGDVEAQLGPADVFAAELRASAGLDEAPSSATVRLHRRLRAADHRAVAAVRARLAQVRRHPEVASSLDGLRRATPLGWAVRGYLAVLVFDVLQGGQHQLWSFPFPGVEGSRLLGLGLAIAGAAASVALGRAARRGGRAPRMASRALTVAVVIGLLGTAMAISNAAWTSHVHHEGVYVDETATEEMFWSEGHLRSSVGEPITNLYPYGPDGEPLEGVLLYDQEGRPIDVVIEHLPDGRRVVTSYPLADDGTPVTNAFPQHQVLRPDPNGDLEHGDEPDPTRRPVVRDVPVLEPADAAPPDEADQADDEAPGVENGSPADVAEGEPDGGETDGGPDRSGQ